MRIDTNLTSLLLLATVPVRTFALFCQSTVSWGEKNESNYYPIDYSCNRYALYNSTRWCRINSKDDACPTPIELIANCSESTEVTTGTSTLPYLFSDAKIDYLEECKANNASTQMRFS